MVEETTLWGGPAHTSCCSVLTCSMQQMQTVTHGPCMQWLGLDLLMTVGDATNWRSPVEALQHLTSTSSKVPIQAQMLAQDNLIFYLVLVGLVSTMLAPLTARLDRCVQEGTATHPCSLVTSVPGHQMETAMEEECTMPLAAASLIPALHLEVKLSCMAVQLH